MKGFIWNIIKLLLLILLPFAILIRAATYMHKEYELYAYLSILVAMVLTSILLFVYFSFIYGSLTGKFGNVGSVKRRGLIAFLLVLVYCLQGVFFLATDNLKSESLKKQINAVHPILRLSVSTLIFIDEDLIITDGERQKEDYRKMGLKTPGSSKHYRQKDGYAHAIDLRTNGRSEIRNFLTVCYFRLLGFKTLRHVGTDDHLHITI